MSEIDAREKFDGIWTVCRRETSTKVFVRFLGRLGFNWLGGGARTRNEDDKLVNTAFLWIVRGDGE